MMSQTQNTANGRSPRECNGHNTSDLNVNPFDKPKVATPASMDDWKPYHFAIAGLPRQTKWARSLAFKVERKNAMRNPAVDTPTLYVSGPDCVTAGASEPDMKAMHALTIDEIAALRMEAAVIRKDCQRQVDEMARRLASSREAVTPPMPISLAEMLDQQDEATTWRVEGLWPGGGRILLAAQYKSGKTTLAGNTIKSLVDGGQLLGRFDVEPVSRVALIDTELDPRTLRRWFRDQGIRNTGAVTVLPLRGAVSSFDILDPARRSQWARCLDGADVVIFDCIRPLIDALGLSEDKDAGRVLVAFDALLAEIGAAEGMVITHMGHHNERARGDSRLLDWPDALWKIVRGGDDTDDDNGRPRFFSALGRDVAVPEGRLEYDTATRHLAYEGGNRRDSADRAAVPELLAMVTTAPGELSKNTAERRLIDDHGVTQRAARAAIATALKNGSLIVTTGARRAQLLSPAGLKSTAHDPYATA